MISISKLPDSIICPPPYIKPIYFDLAAYNENEYLTVPDYIRKQINLKGENQTIESQPNNTKQTNRTLF